MKPTWETSCGPSFITKSHAGLPGVTTSAKPLIGAHAGALLTAVFTPACLNETVGIHVKLCRMYGACKACKGELSIHMLLFGEMEEGKRGLKSQKAQTYAMSGTQPWNN